MKNSIVAISLIILVSCNKDNNSDNPTPPTCDEPATTFKYKWNGQLYEMIGSLAHNAREGSLIRKEQTRREFGDSNYPFDIMNSPDALLNTKYLYAISATKNYYYDGDDRGMFIVKLRTTDFSAPRTYSNSAGDMKSIVFYYPLTAVGDGQKFIINVTKVENGYADGTFNGTVVSAANVIQITEGEFKNVKILH